MNDYKTITDYISEKTNPYNSSGLPLPPPPPPPPQAPVATLRDQFAMAALHMLSLESHPDCAAKKAYAIADAMMEARK